LSFIAPTPGHLLQRLGKIDEFPIRERAEDPGVISANKTPPSGTRQFIASRTTRWECPQEKLPSSLVLQATQKIIGRRAYNMYTMSLYIGVESFYGKPQDS
jgi:hypothetical protein